MKLHELQRMSNSEQAWYTLCEHLAANSTGQPRHASQGVSWYKQKRWLRGKNAVCKEEQEP